MVELLLDGASKVTDVYDGSPTFHDGEILDLHLSSNSTPDVDFPTVSIDFTLHGWEMTSELTPSGHYQLTKHHLIKFHFDGVDAIDLHHFNHQNVLFELIFTKITEPDDHALIKVTFSSSFGLEGGFRAVSGAVLDVIPCAEDGSPNAKNG